MKRKIVYLMSLTAALVLITTACNPTGNGQQTDSPEKIDTAIPVSEAELIEEGNGTIVDNIAALKQAMPLKIWYGEEIIEIAETEDGASLTIKNDWEEEQEEEMIDAEPDMLNAFADDFANQLFEGYYDINEGVGADGDEQAYKLLVRLCNSLAADNKTLQLKLAMADGKPIKHPAIVVTPEIINANKGN